MLSSSLVDKILTDGLRTTTWSIFQTAFLPDEYILHNLILNEYSEYNSVNTNLHVGWGGSNEYSIDDVLKFRQDSNQESGPFFIRKVILSDPEVDYFINNVW